MNIPLALSILFACGGASMVIIALYHWSLPEQMQKTWRDLEQIDLASIWTMLFGLVLLAISLAFGVHA